MRSWFHHELCVQPLLDTYPAKGRNTLVLHTMDSVLNPTNFQVARGSALTARQQPENTTSVRFLLYHANIDDSSNPLHNHKDIRRVRMSTAHRPCTLIAKSFLHRWRQCFETKAKWNLLNSTIGTIFGTVLDRLINDSKMKELVKNSSYRRSYSIMNVGMADFASCRYDARRMRHSSSRHTSVA